MRPKPRPGFHDPSHDIRQFHTHPGKWSDRLVAICLRCGNRSLMLAKVCPAPTDARHSLTPDTREKER